jgi:hypothetical protein
MKVRLTTVVDVNLEKKIDRDKIERLLAEWLVEAMAGDRWFIPGARIVADNEVRAEIIES